MLEVTGDAKEKRVVVVADETEKDVGAEVWPYFFNANFEVPVGPSTQPTYKMSCVHIFQLENASKFWRISLVE
jgi:hypothetical protein